jgi:CheY-like chemotaxis protein
MDAIPPTPAAPPPAEPVTNPDAVVLPVSDPTNTTPASPTILIVEDDMVLQELYFDRFTSAGLTVYQAYDGLQALDMLAEHPEVQLVLLDLMLPKLSGYDVLAQLKHKPELRDIPVIIVSALADIDDQARGLQLGASEYVTKGEMLPGDLIEKIKRYVLSVPGSATS